MRAKARISGDEEISSSFDGGTGRDGAVVYTLTVNTYSLKRQNRESKYR